MSDTCGGLPGDLAEEVYALGVGEDVTLCTALEQASGDSGGFLVINAMRLLNGTMHRCKTIERTRLTYESSDFYDRLVLRPECAMGDALGV